MANIFVQRTFHRTLLSGPSTFTLKPYYQKSAIVFLAAGSDLFNYGLGYPSAIPYAGAYAINKNLFGLGYNGDGTSTYIYDFWSTIQSTDPWTILAIGSSSTVTGKQTFICAGPGGGKYTIMLALDGTTAGCYHDNGTTNVSATIANAVYANFPIIMVATYNGTTIKLFTNVGETSATSTGFGYYTNSTNYLYNNRTGSTADYLNGCLNMAGLFRVALSDTEARQIVNDPISILFFPLKRKYFVAPGNIQKDAFFWTYPP